MGPFIYTTLSQQRDSIKNEKSEHLAYYMSLLFSFKQRFPDNPYLDDALRSISECFDAMLMETDILHDIYNGIMDYLAEVEDITTFILDDYVVKSLIDFFNSLLPAAETRVAYSIALVDYYQEILEVGLLTEDNYDYEKYEATFTQNEKAYILSLLPKEQ